MSKRVFVVKTSEIPDNEGRAYPVEDRMIAVFLSEGAYYAMDDFCPHMGASLAGGCIHEGTVACPWHAWQFGLKDGCWIENPKIKAETYSVFVDGEDLYVEIPESGPAT